MKDYGTEANMSRWAANSEFAQFDLSTHATTDVYAGECYLTGIYCSTVLSAHTCAILNGAAALLTLPASWAAGSNLVLPGIHLSSKLTVTPNAAATGIIVLFYRVAF